MIKVQNVSKIYKLYAQPQDRLKEALHPWRKKYHHDFYALKNIDFEIKKGETVGIIGQNGSGKSTLLKILTGVLTPTDGNYGVEGKISSLLELGTGFNPELSGLENIYFYGSILGFSREQIDAKLEGILSFADIGEFIHQAVKTYSSGMYVRLAFAVAIQVDPDILIVDEALSVGDIKFQLKCFRKFEEFQKAGKTILFVTHDTGAVQNYCSRAIWLNDGVVKEIGEPEAVCKHYMSFMAYGEETKKSETKSNTEMLHATSNFSVSSNNTSQIPWQSVASCESFGDGGAEITHVAFYDKQTNQRLDVLEGGEDVCFSVKGICKKEINDFVFGFMIKDAKGNNIAGMNTLALDKPLNVQGGDFCADFKFTMPYFRNGDYVIMTSVAEGSQINHIQHHWVHDAYNFKLQSLRKLAQLDILVEMANISFDFSNAE